MTDCDSVNASSVTGTGTAGKKWKAFGRAIKSLKQAGRATCIGGQCGQFGLSCSFDPGEITATFEHKWAEDGSGTFVYEATVTSSGGKCVCG